MRERIIIKEKWRVAATEEEKRKEEKAERRKEEEKGRRVKLMKGVALCGGLTF